MAAIDHHYILFQNTRFKRCHEGTPPPTMVSRVLAIRPWPIPQKRIGTSRMVPNRHSSEPIMDGKELGNSSTSSRPVRIVITQQDSV